ncbi:MAG: hypothetical protein QXW70_01145 [Candidatus Anstonellales archaeon]
MEHMDAFAKRLAYSIVGGALVGILVMLFFLKEYPLYVGVVVGSILGAVFAIVVGSLEKEI